MSAPAKKLATGCRPRTLIQKNMNAPIAKMLSAIVQLIAAAEGKNRNSQFGG
jgi:hypothetical protein